MTTPLTARLQWRGPAVAVYFWIFAGSGLGGGARLWCAEASPRIFGEWFPVGILLVNILGSFVIGFFFTFAGPGGRVHVRPTVSQFVMTGLCGGYTTFSAFSLDTLNLLRDGRVLAAGANVGLSLALCLLAVWGGHVLAARLSRPGGG